MSKRKAYKSKEMQYAELRNELNKLDQNVKKLEANLKVTVEQMPSIRKLGSLHSSLFMSAGSVLGTEETQDVSQR